MEKNAGMYSSKTFLFDWRKNDMDILDDMGVSDLSESFFQKWTTPLNH